MLLVDGGDLIEENVPMANLRIRSRKATLSDCTCFLRPGLDVCVLSTSQLTENTSEEESQEPVWLDAKIKSVERKPHEPNCACQFYMLAFMLHKALSQLEFDVRSIQNRIVYHILDDDADNGLLNSESHAKAVNFKLDNGLSVPIVVPFTTIDTLEKGTGRGMHGDEKGSSYDKREFFLRWQSKIKAREVKLLVCSQTEHQPQLDYEIQDQLQLAIVPVLPDETDQTVHEEDPLDTEIPGKYSGDIDEVATKYIYTNGAPRVHRNCTSEIDFPDAEGRWGWKESRKKRHRRRRDKFKFSEKENFPDLAMYRKGPFSAGMYKEMIRRCMENIKSSINKEQPLVIDQWKDFQAGKFSDERDSSDVPQKNVEEDSEIEMLFKEMELCMASAYILEDSELQSTSSVPNKGPRSEQDSGHKSDEDGGGLDLVCVPASSNTPLSEGEDNVWALIPELKRKLRFHQKRAFEFLWRNIAGSVVPADMESAVKARGGCVISHSPGAGKTLLIIAFLVSFLKLFPGARPLVLAPKTTLYTWYKEIIKWEIPIPVYQIHGGQTYRGEVNRQKWRICPGAPKPNQDVMHVLDCMEKIQKWLAHPSVLLMGYTSFLTLTREDSKYSHRKYMGQVLRQSPGILILDEGHNPRSTKSRLRKALMKVDTDLRILLSGTLFQNNFGEYFNTLTLARPRFVKEVLKELDPKFKRRKKGAKTNFSLENRARKLFIDKIGKKIDSSVADERTKSLNTLRNLTGGFIDVYEGGISDNLPGLQCYTLMMKSTPYQQELLTKLQNQRPAYKGFPLELELLITLGSIHPWLIRTTTCSNQYFSMEVLEDLDRYKFDLKFGSKVRFVMSLIPRCLIRKEKVLIFCHNIAPINLFLEIFEAFYGWKKGEEVLVLQGDLELFERGRVMDKFEEPGGASKVMLASINACAEGISLTAASRVILLDSEWNPSKSKQAIARAFRPGQAKEVYVYQLLATGTLEEEKHSRTHMERVGFKYDIQRGASGGPVSLASRED
ncbi:chromatin remodeling 38 [Actinidia rufa]|uniref:Chromatin remodeling 38 n=1 Tax=Actinidia rufa TaxID=165716 RepID=A0A7J0DGE8_9ERIC|nr:chromatin remodeling 38 [Actinidia rufa]